MSIDPNIVQQFDDIINRDEEILWTGAPYLLASILSHGLYLLFCLILFFLFYFYFSLPADSLNYLYFFIFLFGLFELYSIASFKNTYFAISDKRLLVKSGVLGNDYHTLDYDQINDIKVDVNPMEHILGVGTIRTFSTKSPAKSNFYYIHNPYEVFRKIKEVTVDIKTDWNYPNLLRPDVNPGYKTKYRKERGDH